MAQISLNERQTKILGRLLTGFRGKLTVSKWMKMTKCSKEIALRDIYRLVHLGILVRVIEESGRTSYELANIDLERQLSFADSLNP